MEAIQFLLLQPRSLVQLYSGKDSSLAIYKQQILNTWSIAGKLKLVSVQNRPLMVTW
jgi:hypothetical protein